MSANIFDLALDLRICHSNLRNLSAILCNSLSFWTTNAFIFIYIWWNRSINHLKATKTPEMLQKITISATRRHENHCFCWWNLKLLQKSIEIIENNQNYSLNWFKSRPKFSKLVSSALKIPKIFKKLNLLFKKTVQNSPFASISSAKWFLVVPLLLTNFTLVSISMCLYKGNFTCDSSEP